MISEEQILEVREKADIVEIISQYVSLTKKGRDYECLCPFHNDKNNPSLKVSPEKQIFNCFTCNTGGNVFSFVSKFENIGYYDAIRVVASKVGINLGGSYKKNDVLPNKNLYEIMKMSGKFYLNNIFTSDGKNAREYLYKRGISDEIIKEFSIGLSSYGKSDLYNFLKSFEYDDSDIDKLGLINRHGISVFDSFKKRIMIPITNSQNQIVGFTARIYDDSNENKYINSRECVIFKKSDILFNYFNAKNYIRDSNSLIIVEGNMDAIKLASSGIKNVVALMGVFLSSEQIRLISKLGCKIILMLDSDNAGFEATLKNGDILLQNKIICDVVRLSDVKDPDEYILKFGVDALKKNLLNPINYIDFKINTLKNAFDLQTAFGMASFVKNFGNFLSFLDDITKDIVINKVCSELNIEKNLFSGYNMSVAPVTRMPQNSVVVEKKFKKDKYDILSEKIFYYIASDKNYLNIYKNELNFLKHKMQRDLVGEIEIFFQKNSDGKLADFLSYIADNENFSSFMNKVISANISEKLSEQKFLEYLSLMRRKLKEDDICEIKKKIFYELDVDKKIKLIEKLAKIKGSVDYE